MKKLLALSLLCLVACGTDIQAISNDGTKVLCSCNTRDNGLCITNCLRKEVCPNGFDTLDNENKTTLVVKCKP